MFTNRIALSDYNLRRFCSCFAVLQCFFIFHVDVFFTAIGGSPVSNPIDIPQRSASSSPNHDEDDLFVAEADHQEPVMPAASLPLMAGAHARRLQHRATIGDFYNLGEDERPRSGHGRCKCTQTSLVTSSLSVYSIHLCCIADCQVSYFCSLAAVFHRSFAFCKLNML